MMYDAVIVGGGVVGCAIARELSRYRLELCVVERNEDVCTGTSKANSAIVHAGFDAVPGSRKARFNVAGSRMMEPLSRELDFPYRRNGTLVLCFHPSELPRLRELHPRGKKNGVRGLKLLWGDALRQKEPALSPDVVAALHAPTGAIVCPFGLTIALAENAAANGAQFLFDTAVERIESAGDGFRVVTSGGTLESRAVINAAGVYADVLHNQVCPDRVRIVPRKGEYCLLDKRDGGLVRSTVFQLPGPHGKGVLVTPTVHGNLLVGPTAADQEDREGTNTTAGALAYAVATAEKSVPRLPMHDTITSFAGLRAHLADGSDDFRVGESAPGYFEALGIESPGLSAAPAIGAYLAGLVAEKLGLAPNPDFTPQRRDIVHLRELPFARRQALVARDPAYGRIVCRCEQISEGEIRDAIRRVPGARSLDGVKRRCRAGMGRCQGGFCTPRVMEILSRELGIPVTEVTKSGGESRLLAGQTKEVTP
jgi:glycerol-3-phosphate dehydrogenase